MRENIATRFERRTGRTSVVDDGVGQEFSEEMYLAAVPSFESWLTIQERAHASMSRFTSTTLDVSEIVLAHKQKNHPDAPSNVDTTFSVTGRILGYVTADGGLVTHGGGSVLQGVAAEADRLGLIGEARVDYIHEHGERQLARQYPGLNVTKYGEDNRITHSEFSEKWYPHHGIDTAYQTEINNFKRQVEEFKTLSTQQHRNLQEMNMFLMNSLSELGEK